MTDTIAAVDLSPYLPRVATAWATDAPDASWRTVDGSLVFADISGFTALSERLAKRGPVGAEELTDLLGACFTDLLAVAYAEGGSLLKFGGDALLLLFDGLGHELRASRAALGMRGAMRTVGRLATSVGQVKLRMSQGVHSGAIHLFRVGASHKELLICGEAATQVVRMEAAADAGDIVVSPATAAALDATSAAIVGDAKGPGRMLRARTLVHVVEGFPQPVTAPRDALQGLPVALRAHLAAGGGQSEHRHVAIGFVHFDGTDALLAEGGEQATAAALDELVRCVQDACEAEEVTFLGSDIDKDGGKLILVSGAPTALEDADGRLLRSLRRIVDTPRRLAVRIGANRGHVFAGSVGPDYRRTYTVMGDAVNLAARLMAKAAPEAIVASPTTLERSRTAFATRRLAPFHVKGKAAAVTAFVLGRPRGTQETRSVGKSPLVGRDDELACLLGAAGTGGVVRVIGEVGLGKTRLVEELRARVEPSTPIRVVTCEQYQRTTPYFPFRVLLRHELGALRDIELRSAVKRVAPELLPWLALIGDVAGIAVKDSPQTARLAPQYRRQRTALVVTDLLVTLYRRAVIAFDDIQWLDEPSADLLRALAVSAAATELCLVVTHRPGTSTLELDRAASIELGPLDAPAAHALVANTAGDRPLPPDVVTAIVGKAAGNPLFLEELVGAADRADGAIGDLPDSLDAVIATQIDALAPAERQLLRYGAVLGDSFEPELFAEVISDASLADAASIRRRLGGLIVPAGDGRAQFRHRLVRDVAYTGLPFATRRDLHGRAAQVIERAGGEDSHDYAEVLSLHCFHAQQFEKCWRYARIAAAHAHDRHALAEAAESYERAIAAARSVPEIDSRELRDAWLKISRVGLAAGRYKRAREALDNARRLTSDPVELAEVYERHAQLAERSGSPRTAVRWVNRGLKVLADGTTDESRERRAALLALRATLRYQAGKPAEALRLARVAVEAAEASGNDRALAHAHQTADWANTALGRLDGQHAATALRLFEKLEDDENAAIVLLSMGGMAYYSGRWMDALACYERSKEIFDEIGAMLDSALASGNMAEIFADQGRLDDAERMLLEALSTWRALRIPVGEALATRYLARVHLRRGDRSLALEMFAGARATLETYQMAPKVLEIDVWMAECLLANGRVDEAEALLARSLAQEVASGASEMRPTIHRLRAYAAVARGDVDAACTELDESLAVARQRHAAYDIALALGACSVVGCHSGREVDPVSEDERIELLRSLGITTSPAAPIPALVAPIVSAR